MTAHKTTAAEENKNTLRDDKLDEDTGKDKLSSDQLCDTYTSDENTLSSTCPVQNPSVKTEKFYSVSSRDRNIISCSLGDKSSSGSVVVVNIAVDDMIDTSPVSKTMAACGDLPKTRLKESPKPRPRFHGPSGPAMETSSSAVMTNDKDESEATCQRTEKGDMPPAQNNELGLNKSSVTLQRIKPPTLPKKAAVLKLQRTKVGGGAGYGSDDGLSALTQVRGSCSHNVDLKSWTKVCISCVHACFLTVGTCFCVCVCVCKCVCECEYVFKILCSFLIVVIIQVTFEQIQHSHISVIR